MIKKMQDSLISVRIDLNKKYFVTLWNVFIIILGRFNAPLLNEIQPLLNYDFLFFLLRNLFYFLLLITQMN